MIRSHLWEPDAWPPLEGLPTLAKAAIGHAKLTHCVAEIQGFVATDERTWLY